MQAAKPVMSALLEASSAMLLVAKTRRVIAELPMKLTYPRDEPSGFTRTT